MNKDRSFNISNSLSSTAFSKQELTAIMCAPPLNIERLKKRRDPFTMLGKVKTNYTLKSKPSNRFESTMSMACRVKNPLSSTMLGSPDGRCHQMMNLSSISGFSSISKISPVVPDQHHKFDGKNLFVNNVPQVRSPVSSQAHHQTLQVNF